MGYLISLIVFISLYILALFLLKRLKRVKFWNIVFTLSVFSLYLAVSITVYLDTGFYDWNFQNTLPCANVSPFTFFITPFILLLPNKIKKYPLTLISLLSVGMFLAGVFGCIYNFSINYALHYHFLFDYLAHFILSLWGVYIVKSNQIELNLKNAIKSGLIIVTVAVIFMIINLMFDTSYFGLNLNGKHNIYNVVLVSNSYVSALLYFIGLIVVLVLGYVYNKILNSKGKIS